MTMKHMGQSIFRLAQCTVLISTVALLIHPKAAAQADSGRVVGTVTDTTGAAIPNATVTLTNVENGSVRTATTSGSGELNISAIPAGNYSARVEAPGFASQSVTFAVIVTQSQNLKFALTPGATSSMVEVTSAAPLVNTSDPTLGETIEAKQITELPLNGRNALNLALLTPGVTQGTYTEFGQDTVGRFGDTGGGVLSINGTRPQANNFILDGVDNNDGLQNVILFFPPVDATQEFKVITNVAPAQYGRAGGALVISSIRSGSNQFHGSAFEFYRSGKWAANPNYRFLGASSSPNPAYNQSQFGGSAGLPLIKDKLFIFGDYQGTRILTPFSGHFDTVPTALMRQGDFSELLNPALNGGSFTTSFPLCVANAGTLNNNIAANSKGQIYDPQTCTPFPGNKIPLSRLNPAAVNYFNAFPLPTRTDRVLNNYFTSNSSTRKGNSFDARLDWRLSPQNIFFFRASYDNSTSNQGSELAQNGSAPPLSANGQRNFIHARGYDLGLTHTFSPYAVNEARIAYNRDNYGFAPSNNGIAVGQQLGIANSNLGVAATGGPLIGGTGTQLTYTGDFGLFAVPQNTYEATDTLNLTRGRHSLNLGGTFLRRQVSYFRPILGKGGFFVNPANFTGYDETEYLVGGVDNYQIGSQTGYFANISQEDAVFAQDDWRVNKRLTLNLGLRWDLLTWPYEMHNKQASFDPATGAVLEAGVNGVSRSIVNQDYANFAPRVGFAYDIFGDGKTALHGGYGIFYYPDYGGISNQLGQNPPFGGVVFYFARNGNCITFTGQTSTKGAPYTCPGYTNPAAATTPLPPPGFPNFNPANPPQGLGGTAVNRNNQHSRLQEWNLQLEQQLSTRDLFSAAYVGTRGDRLSTLYKYGTNLNAYRIGGTTLPFPNLGYIPYIDYNGISNYSGLQLHYEHRAANFTATASYSWSHALDSSDSTYDGTPVAILLYYNPASNYGNSNFDERHIASTSFIYNLPFGRGQRFEGGASRPLDLVIGGWQLNNIVLLSTGQPVDLQAQGSAAPGNRPDLIGPIRYPKSISGQWFDPSSFSNNIPIAQATDRTTNSIYTRVGTLGRNQIYGPGNRVMNLGIQKNIRITEGRQLELHGDAFNVTNTPNFANPNNFNGGPGSNFGRITGLRGAPRQIQIAARFVF